eukprot:7419820-Prorocentrum_lima.AAC.1
MKCGPARRRKVTVASMAEEDEWMDLSAMISVLKPPRKARARAAYRRRSAASETPLAVEEGSSCNDAS